MSNDEYNPLDYENLTINLIRELMARGPFCMDLEKSFTGAGVYALFYNGDFDPYEPLRSTRAKMPIYVGKAVPPGARKGSIKGDTQNHTQLYKRLNEHKKSIEAADNLDVADFRCRFLVVTPLWITMAERFLIEYFRPIWNQVIDGFGLHDPGGGRRKGEISWWDALHPGRAWAEKQRNSRTQKQATKKLTDFLKEHPPVTSLKL